MFGACEIYLVSPGKGLPTKATTAKPLLCGPDVPCSAGFSRQRPMHKTMVLGRESYAALLL